MPLKPHRRYNSRNRPGIRRPATQAPPAKNHKANHPATAPFHDCAGRRPPTRSAARNFSDFTSASRPIQSRPPSQTASTIRRPFLARLRAPRECCPRCRPSGSTSPPSAPVRRRSFPAPVRRVQIGPALVVRIKQPDPRRNQLHKIFVGAGNDHRHARPAACRARLAM